MGGLGPTEDDLTRECVAETLGRPLKRHARIVEDLRARFAARGWKMSENNERQGDVIDGAEALDNKRGSAPGQFLHINDQYGHAIIVLLPGPPHELRGVFEEHVFERLKRLVPGRHIAMRELKIGMIGESMVDKRAAPIYKAAEGVETTILAGSPGEVQLHLRAQADSLEEAQKRVDALASLLEDEFEDAIFSTKGESMEQIVGYYLGMREKTLAVAESCTGGMLAERITSVPGSSRYFLGGAVSSQVAAALAEGIRTNCKATLGIGITGVAGPAGGSEKKPVGLVFHALADGNHTEVIERNFPGDRDRIRTWATQQALDMVRRKLM